MVGSSTVMQNVLSQLHVSALLVQICSICLNMFSIIAIDELGNLSPKRESVSSRKWKYK